MNTILNIGEQIVNILRSIHKEGIIYRDVKPENFLIGNTEKTFNKLYICDFGLAKFYMEPDENAKIEINQIKSPVFSSLKVSPRMRSPH